MTDGPVGRPFLLTISTTRQEQGVRDTTQSALWCVSYFLVLSCDAYCQKEQGTASEDTINRTILDQTRPHHTAWLMKAYLHTEEEDRRQPEPTVEGVEVRDGRRLVQVVRVKDRLEGCHGAEEGKRHQGSVHQLEPGLALGPECSVHQDPCTISAGGEAYL